MSCQDDAPKKHVYDINPGIAPLNKRPPLNLSCNPCLRPCATKEHPKTPEPIVRRPCPESFFAPCKPDKPYKCGADA